MMLLIFAGIPLTVFCQRTMQLNPAIGEQRVGT